MSAQSVEKRRTLAGELLTNPISHQFRLIVDRAQRHEPLFRPQRRFANRRCIGCVRLVAPDVGFHVRGRDQLYFMSQRRNFTTPIVCACASVHRHNTGREAAKKLQHATAPQLADEHGLALRVDAVNLKTLLARSSPTRVTRANFSVDFAVDGSPQMGFDNSILAQLMPSGRRPPHQSQSRTEFNNQMIACETARRFH